MGEVEGWSERKGREIEESNFLVSGKFSALSLENIIDHVSLFETLVHSWRKTHGKLIIQMYNEITNSITICTTKVFNISEH